MKCLILCTENEVKWIREYFADQDPYMLRIANKPYLEYLVDFCVLNKISEIKIILDQPEPEVESFLGNGERYGLCLSYGLTSPGLSIWEIISRNIGALGGDDLLILNGMFWLQYDQRNFRNFSVGPDEIIQYGNHFTLVGKNRNTGMSHPDSITACPESDAGIKSLNSIQKFYSRCMSLVRGEANHYSMPSYSNTPNVYIGQNVSLSRTANVQKPVQLGNVIQIGEHTQIGPDSIIGDNSFIDDHTTIVNSVVMANTYIGCYLEIVGKIVYRNMIINPENGVKLDIIDDFVLTQISEETTRIHCTFFHRLGALLLWLIYLIPWLVLRPLTRIKTEIVECYLNIDLKKRIKLRLYIKPPRRWPARWFQKLSLDRYHLLPLVMRGEIRLVGSKILPVSKQNEKLLHQFPDYSPGLFSYSEMLEHNNDHFQSEMDELYYIYHASFRLNWRIIRKTLTRNLLKETY